MELTPEQTPYYKVSYTHTSVHSAVFETIVCTNNTP